MSYVTCDMLHVVGSEHSLKMLAFMVWERQCFEDILTKDDSLTNLIYQLITKLFVDKPTYSGSAKKKKSAIY